MAKNKKTYVGSSAFKFPVMAALGIAQVGLGIYNAFAGGAARRRARDNEEEARKEAEKYLQQYKDFDPRVQSPYEDLTVNLEQARFMRQQQAQQSADTLDQLRQAGGSGAGLAALATAMAGTNLTASSGQLNASAGASVGLILALG